MPSSAQSAAALSPTSSSSFSFMTPTTSVSVFHSGLLGEVVEEGVDFLTPELTAEACAPSSQTVTSDVGSARRSASAGSKMKETEVTVEEARPDALFEPPSSTPAPPAVTVVKDEVQILRLKRNVKRLKAAIRHIESRKSELSDWFLEQMVSQVRGDDGVSISESDAGKLPEGDIKRVYKKRNAELKQRLNDLDARLSNTILIISRLETQQNSEVDSQFDRSASSSIAVTPVAENTSISKVSRTIKHSPTPTEDQQQKADTMRNCLPSLPSSSKSTFTLLSDKETNLKAQPPPSSSSTPMKSYFEQLLQPSSLVSQSTVTTKTSTGNAELDLSTSFLGAVNGSTERIAQAHLLPDNTDTSPQTPLSFTATSHHQPSSSKKLHSSARRALKYGFGLLSKSISRRSEVHNIFSSPLALKKSASAEYLHTKAAFAALNDTSVLNMAPYAVNDRPMSSNAGASWMPKWKNSSRQDDVATADFPGHLETIADRTKKGHAGSVSSRPSPYHQYHDNYLRHHHVYTGESEVTSAGCSDKSGAVGSSSSPPPYRKSSTQRSTRLSTTSTMAYSNVIDVIDALYGGNAASSTGMPRSNLFNPHVTSSGGASTYSGGGCAAAAVTNGLPTVEVGTMGGGNNGNPQFSPSCSPPPAYNVAMALVMLHQRIQALLETHIEAQQTLTSEIREEITSLRMDLTETRDIANSITVEVGALRRDMQTKEDVQNQKLLDAVARLEQLDASAEKLRQNVQQDLITIRNEQKHAIEPINYQLATETRDLRDMFTTLSNKVVLLEKCERLSILDRDQPQLLRAIANTLTNLVVSLVAFVTTLIQMLIRFLNAGATITNNRVWAIVVNVCLLVFLLMASWAEPLVRWWFRIDPIVQQPPR